MVRPRRYVPNLIADSAECDANYIRLRRLFPAMAEQDHLVFGIDAAHYDSSEGPVVFSGSDSDSASVVSIEVKERCRYTTMLTVTVSGDVLVPEDDGRLWISWPCLEVRLYDDVKSAEVVSFEHQRNIKSRYNLPNKRMYQPDEKSQINKFFGELLTHCATHGHSLETLELG